MFCKTSTHDNCSRGMVWSLYKTSKNAEVHAPPDLPAGFGNSNLLTLLTSALVWESEDPDIMCHRAGMAVSIFRSTVVVIFLKIGTQQKIIFVSADYEGGLHLLLPPT